jgi:hypothetical protein
MQDVPEDTEEYLCCCLCDDNSEDLLIISKKCEHVFCQSCMDWKTIMDMVDDVEVCLVV